MWNEISCITSDGKILPFAKTSKKSSLALKVLKGDTLGVASSILEACKIRKSQLQRNIIETLLLSEDCTIDEVVEITGVSNKVLKDYVSLFFRYKNVFSSRIDILDYIETGIRNHTSDEDDSELMSFLYKRWALTLGKEFVIWRFNLKPVDYTPGLLYQSVFKEAFFYHKERSMGKEDISTADYLRSVKSVLDSIKASLSIKDESKEDDAFDMQQELDIIIEDSIPQDTTTTEEKDKVFINNT